MQQLKASLKILEQFWKVMVKVEYEMCGSTADLVCGVGEVV